MTAVEITEPGVYDIDEASYHADPVPGGSLSQSGAKKLLKEGGPALFAWEREHPRPSTKAQDLGTAAHKLVLGTGQELHEVKADNWRGSKANDDAGDARTQGKLPLLTKELAVVTAMAAKLREHEWAMRLLGQPGRPEMSAFWPDSVYPVYRRLRWDFMPEPHPARRPVLVDYKTTASAGPKWFAKSIADFGYHMQADWYCAGYQAMFGAVIAELPVMAFIGQEKEPPYRVVVYQLHPDALRKGRADNERAMEIYRDCREAEADGRANAWPGYSQEIEVIDLPYWSYRED